MGSKEIRRRLRSGATPQRDTRHIHELARALARERLHLGSRPPRPGPAGDLLWSQRGESYKIACRTVREFDEPTTIEVSASTDADFLLAVFLEKETFRLVGIVRIRWSMVEWLGRAHGGRWRLPWAADSAVRGIAEVM